MTYVFTRVIIFVYKSQGDVEMRRSLIKKYFYPAVFHEEDGGYWVEFPELPGCVTQGDTFEEAYEMAAEALGLYLEMENGFKYPDTSKINMAELDKNSCIVMVEFDEIEYLKKMNDRSVKKTLTIPKWLDILATRKNINFSQTLQNALMENIVDM